MSNTDKGRKLIEKICSGFEIKEKKEREKNYWISVSSEIYMKVLKCAKEAGFDHCSAISITDWPDKGLYEFTYHLWSYADRLGLIVKTEVSRERAEIDSVNHLWGESAQVHERELHEMFGVNFKGNPDLNPLFLENWDGPPPFRKDFNWRDHVRKEHYDRENEREAPYWD